MKQHVAVLGLCGIDLLCKLEKSNIDAEDGMGYTTYGVRVVDLSGDECYHLSDISTDRDFVLHFICTLESHNVSLVHIGDILEDMMP